LVVEVPLERGSVESKSDLNLVQQRLEATIQG
jgi:hypothetical protein